MADHQGLRQASRQAGIWALVKKAGTAAALAGAILVAGCQTMVPRTAPPVEPVRQVTPPPPPQSDALPSDAERNRVALIVPISGPNAAVGQSIANATTLALLETKTDKLRITTYDAYPNAAAAAQRAVEEGNRLILGPLLAEDVRNVAPVARRAGVPVISYSNDASAAGDGIFLMGFNPVQSIERVVGYARAKGVKRFAALVPRGTYGERAGTAFLRAVEQAGGTVTAMEVFDPGAASMSAAVKKLQAKSPYDAILIADSGRIAIQAAPLVRKGGGAGARILGTELWNTESSILGSVDLRGAWFASVSDDNYRQLANNYRQRYGAAPYRLSSLGYDSVLLTVRIAQNWRPGTPFPVARLTDPDGFVGVDGAFRFGRSGIAERMLEISQVNAGSSSVIDPAARKFAP